MNRQAIGAAIRARREQLKMTVGEVATRAGMSASTVYRIENSGHFSTEAMLFICDALEIEPSRLMRRAERLAEGK